MGYISYTGTGNTKVGPNRGYETRGFLASLPFFAQELQGMWREDKRERGRKERRKIREREKGGEERGREGGREEDEREKDERERKERERKGGREEERERKDERERKEERKKMREEGRKEREGGGKKRGGEGGRKEREGGSEGEREKGKKMREEGGRKIRKREKKEDEREEGRKERERGREEGRKEGREREKEEGKGRGAVDDEEKNGEKAGREGGKNLKENMPFLRFHQGQHYMEKPHHDELGVKDSIKISFGVRCHPCLILAMWADNTVGRDLGGLLVQPPSQAGNPKPLPNLFLKTSSPPNNNICLTQVLGKDSKGGQKGQVSLNCDCAIHLWVAQSIPGRFQEKQGAGLEHLRSPCQP
ncbi:Histone-lysine N-methyltransferase, H3 lysine-79 specific, partial [Ophiophagus hannah]